MAETWTVRSLLIWARDWLAALSRKQSGYAVLKAGHNVLSFKSVVFRERDRLYIRSMHDDSAPFWANNPNQSNTRRQILFYLFFHLTTSIAR